ncbi:SulP family inorganic anion transporter [Planosporangium sp. 12N6]|uniref:SulP family inorganic anion transporter n=1 Tax=Planosporangium spinosum TaxID=3402278 RepID=UPI003CEBD867
MRARFLPDARTLRQDFSASLVVFLVALPLCLGVAVASGVPAELGLVTGIVGGLVVGVMRGSSLQVSGPAAGLTVLVYEAVQTHGIARLGMIVLAAGALQMLLGALRMGRWFRAISSSVVSGMLAGIGLVLMVGQAYTLFDRAAPGGALANLAGLPALVASVDTPAAAALGVGTIAVMAGWRYAPRRLRVIPAPLVGVALATAAAAALRLPVERLEVRGLMDAVRLPGLADLEAFTSAGVLGTALAFALIASAESLFSAAAVDRMHNGPRTDYDRELFAQGTGNAVCGLLGALPMTAVIVRSAANVQAGAATKASRILHGAWLLLFAVLLPAALGVIPMAALAGVLVYSGAKLVPLRAAAELWRANRGEALVLTATAVTIVATNLLEGVLVGLLLSLVKCAGDVSHVQVHVNERADSIRVRITGNATFMRLPRILDALEAVPHGRPVELDVSGLRHVDHTCRAALVTWAANRNHGSCRVDLPEYLSAVSAAAH